MRPDVPLVLERTLGQLAMEVLPALPSGYAQGAFGAQLALLAAIREEVDRAAARRVEENRALRELLARGAGTVTEPSLAARLREAGGGADDDLTVSALQEANDTLRGLLTLLHARLEEQDDPAARALEADLWDELRRSTERRALSMGPF